MQIKARTRQCAHTQNSTLQEREGWFCASSQVPEGAQASQLHPIQQFTTDLSAVRASELHPPDQL